jgi:hypothetical protein
VLAISLDLLVSQKKSLDKCGGGVADNFPGGQPAPGVLPRWFMEALAEPWSPALMVKRTVVESSSLLTNSVILDSSLICPNFNFVHAQWK